MSWSFSICVMLTQMGPMGCTIITPGVSVSYLVLERLRYIFMSRLDQNWI